MKLAKITQLCHMSCCLVLIYNCYIHVYDGYFYLFSIFTLIESTQNNTLMSDYLYNGYCWNGPERIRLSIYSVLIAFNYAK